MSSSKASLRGLILQRLEADLALQTDAARLAHDEATSEESRAENKYDTHSQEAAYLAEGQARLAAEITEAIALYHALPLPDLPAEAPIALGSLVELDRNGQSAWYFIGPRAGGLELNLDDGREVLVVTPSSPLGRLLMGQRAGSSVAAPGPKAGQQVVRRVL